MRLSSADKAFQVCCFLFLALAGLLVAYPLIYVVACSFSSPMAIILGKVVLWPVDFGIDSYRAVFNYGLLRSGFVNSLFYVAGGTSVAVSLLVLAAYPLSRKDMPHRKLLLIYFVITMFFSGGIIPNYLLMQKLHLVGSRLALVLGFMFSCYNMIIVKSYFQNNIPASLLDAAHIDGCGDLRFFFTIALPLSTPVIAVMVLFNAVGIWNGYFNAMMFLTKPATWSFQVVLRQILFVTGVPADSAVVSDAIGLAKTLELAEQMRYAVLVVGALPMMLLYPFIQRYFIRGIMIGSLKE